MSNQIEPYQTISNSIKHLSNYFELFSNNGQTVQTISNNFKLLHQTLKN